jgi:hypothetical protein
MLTWEDVRALARELPEVEEGPGWGGRCFRVRTKWFVGMSGREPNMLVVRVDLDERLLLIGSNPETYFLTPHYERGSYLLVRLGNVTTDELRERLIDAWLLAAPKRLAATLELD